MKGSSPYQEFEESPAWRVIHKGIRDLEKNGDIEERTPSRYIVGYLTKLLVESGLLAEPANQAPADPARRTG